MNLELSQSIATLIEALQNCCYRNAMLALLTLPQLATWRYVEGWVITSEWPIEHGWLLSPTGEVVDPTLALFGQRYTLACYFGGLSFGLSDLTYYYPSGDPLLNAQHITPLVYRSRWALPEYEAAKARAYARRYASR